MEELNTSLEQEFRIKSFEIQVDQMDLEQAREMLKIIHRAYVAAEELNKTLLKQSL